MQGALGANNIVRLLAIGGNLLRPQEAPHRRTSGKRRVRGTCTANRSWNRHQVPAHDGELASRCMAPRSAATIRNPKVKQQANWQSGLLHRTVISSSHSPSRNLIGRPTANMRRGVAEVNISRRASDVPLGRVPKRSANLAVLSPQNDPTRLATMMRPDAAQAESGLQERRRRAKELQSLERHRRPSEATRGTARVIASIVHACIGESASCVAAVLARQAHAMTSSLPLESRRPRIVGHVVASSLRLE